MAAPRPRWWIPRIAAAAGVVWVSDVTAPGLFAIDVRSLDVRGRVAVEAEDDRTPGAGSASEVDANDRMVVTTGLNQGDIVIVDREDLEVTTLIRVGRSLEALCVGGSAIWVDDVVEEVVRRVEPDGRGSATLRVEGTPGCAADAFEAIWLVTSTNVMNDIGRLYRVDPTRVEITANVHLTGMPDTVCATEDVIWVLGTVPTRIRRREHDASRRVRRRQHM